MREFGIKPINLLTSNMYVQFTKHPFISSSAFIDIETPKVWRSLWQYPATEGMLVMNRWNVGFMFFIQYFLKELVSKLPTTISTTICYPNESSRITLNIHWIVLENLSINLVEPCHFHGKCYSYVWHRWHHPYHDLCIYLKVNLSIIGIVVYSSWYPKNVEYCFAPEIFINKSITVYEWKNG